MYRLSSLARLTGWVPVLVILVAIASGLPWQIRLQRLVAVLRPLTVAERGQLASDDRRSVLALAGRAQMRELIVTRQAGPPARPAVGDIWRWCHDAAPHIPPDARVYLNVPAGMLYPYGLFFWHPAEVALTPRGGRIASGEDLAAAAVRIPEGQLGRLAELGFTHVVTAGPGGLRLVPLAGSGSSGR